MVFAANKGVLSRWLKSVYQCIGMAKGQETSPYRHAAFRMLAVAARASDILQEAEKDRSGTLFCEVLEKGIVRMVFDEEPQTKPFWKLFSQPGYELDDEAKSIIFKYFDRIPVGPYPC